MNTAIRRFGKVLVLLLGLLLVAWTIVLVLRGQAYGDTERTAVALMEAPPPAVPGSNGFAALMLADREVPADQREAALAADVARFGAWLAHDGENLGFWATSHGEMPEPDPPFVPFADTTFPLRAPLPLDAPLCGMNQPGCLAKAQAEAATLRELLQAHAGRTADVEAALAADQLVNPYPPSLSTPLPPMNSFRLPLTAAALDAVDGRVPEAYARTCRLLAGARRLDRQGQNLLEKMIAQALAEGAGWLLLDLRRAHPVAALPADCAAALAPLATGEAAICEAMRGEYRMNRAIDDQLARRVQGWRPDNVLTRALLYDSEVFRGWMASGFAAYCSDDARRLAADGELPPPPAPPVGFGQAVCYAAYLNCVLVQISQPNYDGYAGRSLDHVAQLRLLIAAQAVADGRMDAAAAAAAAGSAAYPVSFDAATQKASVLLRAPRGDAGDTFIVDFAGLAPVAAPAEPATP